MYESLATVLCSTVDPQTYSTTGWISRAVLDQFACVKNIPPSRNSNQVKPSARTACERLEQRISEFNARNTYQGQSTVLVKSLSLRCVSCSNSSSNVPTPAIDGWITNCCWTFRSLTPACSWSSPSSLGCENSEIPAISCTTSTEQADQQPI
jgi:hypothetical protein